MEPNYINMKIVAIATTVIWIAGLIALAFKLRAERKRAESYTLEQQHAAYSQGCDEECGI